MSILRRLFGREKPGFDGQSESSADSSGLARPVRGSGFSDSAELAAYVTAQLAQSVPKGWRVERLRDPLAWAIKKECPEPGKWYDQEYNLWITKDLELLLITHDNGDIGGSPTYAYAVLLRVGRGMKVAEAVRYVTSQFKPNEWGYT